MKIILGSVITHRCSESRLIAFEWQFLLHLGVLHYCRASLSFRFVFRWPLMSSGMFAIRSVNNTRCSRGLLATELLDRNGRKQFLLCFQAEVEVVEQYSDPRDSKNKAYVEPGAETSLPTIYSKVNRNYCRPYTGKWCITFVV